MATTKTTAQSAAAKLGPSGRELWRSVTRDYELRIHEERILLEACRVADLLDRISREVGDGPVVDVGSRGQSRANPLLGEARLLQDHMARLIAALKLPADPDPAPSVSVVRSRSSSARALANARWNRRGA